MSVAICNMAKLEIIQQKTFYVSCLFCKTIHFLAFTKKSGLCYEERKGIRLEVFIVGTVKEL